MSQSEKQLIAGKPSAAIKWLIVFFCILLICSCAGTPSTGQFQPVPKSMRPTEKRLRAEVDHWLGTPHRMGGNGRSGIDCSAWVQRIYNEIFDVKLPRTTVLQVKRGKSVSKKKLRTGDLVFFHPPNKVRHVGIYLSKGEFAHASSTKGVTISNLNNPYWRKAYWTARRIVRIRS